MKIVIFLLLVAHSATGAIISSGFVLNGIVLESSDFKSVFRLFKESTRHKKGDASEAYEWVCYKTVDAKFIEFGSGEMGGGNITDITLYEPSNIKSINTTDCIGVPHSSKDIKFNNGIGLKSKINTVEKVLGKARVSSNRKQVYNFERQVDKEFTENLSVEIEYDKNNIISKLHVSKETSN